MKKRFHDRGDTDDYEINEIKALILGTIVVVKTMERKRGAWSFGANLNQAARRARISESGKGTRSHAESNEKELTTKICSVIAEYKGSKGSCWVANANDPDGEHTFGVQRSFYR